MSDNRTTLTDAVATLGMLIDPAVQKRDAIHLATEPVIAGEKLYPGQDIGLGADGLAYAYGIDKLVGIADPFLKAPVMSGEAFWLIVYPRQITHLRHTWEHPDFPETAVKQPLEKLEVTSLIKEPSERQKAVILFESVAEEHDLDYDRVLSVAKYSEGEEELWIDGKYIPVDESFWEAYTSITGEAVTLGGYDDGCRGC